MALGELSLEYARVVRRSEDGGSEVMESTVVNALGWARSQAFDLWKKSVDAQLGRTQSLYDRFATVEAHGRAQTEAAVAEWARLVVETLKYQTELTSAWRKHSLDAMTRLSTFGTTKSSSS